MIALEPKETKIGALLHSLQDICASDAVFTSGNLMQKYSKDNTLDLNFPFDLLVLPDTAEKVAAVLKLCNEHGVPLTPRGGGTGVTGGALPVNRGVVLSLERLNKIIRIDRTDQYVIAESGVITAAMCKAVEEQGLYFPVQPGSSSSSFIGGNVSENAGGIASCKYGTTERYVLNLELALPTGELIWTGANVAKNATGFNLTSLVTGSEGVLGVITKVVYRLLHKPVWQMSMLARFNSTSSACDAVIALRQSGMAPSAVEFIGSTALQLTESWLGLPSRGEEAKTETQLLIEFLDNDQPGLAAAAEKAKTLLGRFTETPAELAWSAGERDKLWSLRFAIGSAMTSEERIYRDIDACIPVRLLNEFLGKTADIGRRYGVPVACFGHAWDGNLHTMLLSNRRSPSGDNAIGQAAGEIYAYVISIGGVLSGEHGIGLLQKEFMPSQYSRKHLELMKQIKRVFDPNGILNPGKIF